MQAYDFEWIDPNGKNGPVTFEQDGRLGTVFGQGTWKVVDTKTLTVNFGKQGEMTLEMHPAHQGQEWNVVRPKKAAQARLSIQN